MLIKRLAIDFEKAAKNRDSDRMVRANHDFHMAIGGCTEFCVNGLMTSNRRISRSGYDLKHKESSTQRSH